jgi:hypothetical protein
MTFIFECMVKTIFYERAQWVSKVLFKTQVGVFYQIYSNVSEPDREFDFQAIIANQHLALKNREPACGTGAVYSWVRGIFTRQKNAYDNTVITFIALGAFLNLDKVFK